LKIPALPDHQATSRNTSASAKATSRDTGTAGATVTARATDTRVALSAASRQLAALHHPAMDVDMARVDQIRQALSDGTLVIRPERIADGLLQTAIELLRP